MTKGLTKLAAATLTPAVPGVPSTPPIAERWYLSPPPPGYYYSLSGTEWTLKQSSAPPSGGSGMYTINMADGQNVSIPLPPGATVIFYYGPAVTGVSTYQTTMIAPSNPIFAWPDAPEGLVLQKIEVYPNGTAAGGSTAQLYNVPVTAVRIDFQHEVYSNGYPKGNPATVVGLFQVPNAAGGMTTVTRTYSPSGQAGLYVPISGDADPPYLTTSSGGVRASRLASFPGSPAYPGTPAFYTYTNVKAWDAGANSIGELGGDVYVKLTGPESVGAYVGFFEGSVRASEDYTALSHAFYFALTPTGRKWFVYDQGRTIQISDTPYTLTDEFEIRRVSGTIYYFVNGVMVYRSQEPSSGDLRVGTSMYATGDKVL